MPETVLMAEIRQFSEVCIRPLITAGIPVPEETIQKLGRGLNELLGKSTIGKEQLLIQQTRDLLTQIPKEKTPKEAQANPHHPVYGY